MTSPSMLVEVFRIAHQHDVGAELFQSAAVRIEITLQCENTDLHERFRSGLLRRSSGTSA